MVLTDAVFHFVKDWVVELGVWYVAHRRFVSSTLNIIRFQGLHHLLGLPRLVLRRSGQHSKLEYTLAWFGGYMRLSAVTSY